MRWLPPALLLLLCANWTGAQTGTPANSVRRLAPSAFPQLPAGVRRKLEARDCLIPQAWNAHALQNVVSGAFTAAAMREWAVLCSVRGISQILIYRAGPGNTAQLVDSLRRSPDEMWVQSIGDGQWGYSRLLQLVPRAQVRHWREDVDGNRIPQPIDHDALSQVYLEKAAVAFYFAACRWYRQLTAD